MLGASRDSRAKLQEWVDRNVDPAAGTRIADELYAVVALLDREAALRGSLSDAGVDADARAALARQLFGPRLADSTVRVVGEVARQRWSSPRDLADVLEEMALRATFAAAEANGRIDRVEDELFRFGRTVEAQPALRQVLTDPALPADRKVAVVTDLVGQRADGTTIAVLSHLIQAPRGRSIEEALELVSQLGAERRGRIVADVRTANPLTADQERRLGAALARIYNREVQLQVTVDPGVLGGAVVQIGDEVIDGTIAHKLEQARRSLR